VIGLALETQEAIRGQFSHSWIMSQCYVRVLADAGALPWLIPLLEGEPSTLRAIYERLDGVFLTGGVDVEPGQYQEERHALCGETDPARDRVELNLVRWAVADGKPVLGICRGAQVINVALGGSLYQDIACMVPEAARHDYFTIPGDPVARSSLVHDVRVKASSRLAEILGSESVRVNSMHHQGIKRLAPGLTASAIASDGLIEGVEGLGTAFLVGVQWHPEELVETQAEMRRLFSAFVEAAKHPEPALASSRAEVVRIS
jgi:putative glutamine amidotransferase